MPEGEALLGRLRSGEGLSLEEIQGLDPSAIPAVRELALRSDPRARRAALIVLVQRKAPGCEDVYERALREGDADLAFRALEGFETRLEPWQQAALLAAYDARPEGHVRGAIARTIGTLDDRADYWEFKKRADAERDEEAKEGVLFALARMGDGAARTEVVRRVQAAKEIRKLDFFDRHLPYLKGRWLLNALLPFMDDEEVVFDGRSLYHGGAGEAIPEMFCRTERACDRAVCWAAEISGQSFSFPVERMVNYTPAQRDEVREFLRRQP
jgi:hypothetical protein